MVFEPNSTLRRRMFSIISREGLNDPFSHNRQTNELCHLCYVRMEYEERNRKKEAKEIAVLEVMEKMKEAEHQ